jgi:hypothetical protein
MFSSFPALIGLSQTNRNLDFDGVNDYVNIGSVNSIGTSDFTIETWVYVESLTGTGQKIINKGMTGSSTPSHTGYGLRACFFANNSIEFHIAYSGTYKNIIYYGLALQKWTHIAGVRKGKNLFLYVNGELVGQDSTSFVFNVNCNLDESIGALYRGSAGANFEFLSGKTDEVRIWNISRTRAEILGNMNCAITSAKTGLMAVYNFNTTSTTILYDSSGNNNIGIINSSPTRFVSTVANYCFSDLNEEKVNNIKLYPNPFQSNLNFSENIIGNYQIYDFTGKLVYSDKVNSKKIDLSNLKKGFYVIEIKSDKALIREKIIKS